jgi:adenylate cyclase class 2
MQEIEAKFYVRDLKRVELYVQDLAAQLIQPRILETNIRFDLPDGRLRSEGRVLRLRHDTESHLTYKDAGKNDQGVLNRKEIEFKVEDFDRAKSFLEALGYQEFFIYEKYRTTYEMKTSEVLANLGGLVHIMLDELPYGNFVEIEGEANESIHAAAKKLNLDLNASIPASYSALFERVRRARNLTFTDLTFANFEGIQVAFEQLQVQPAD